MESRTLKSISSALSPYDDSVQVQLVCIQHMVQEIECRQEIGCRQVTFCIHLLNMSQGHQNLISSAPFTVNESMLAW